MQETNQTNLNDPAELGNVDQIREILFGSQTRELNKRFEKLESDIKRSFDDLKVKIEQGQKDFNNRLENEVDLISKKIKNLIVQQNEELSDIKESELKQEKRIQHSIDLLNEELSSKHDQLYKEQLDNKNGLIDDMNLLKLELFEFLELRLSELNELKLSRDDASEIMMETAMRLKGNNLEKQLNLVTTDTEEKKS